MKPFGILLFFIMASFPLAALDLSSTTIGDFTSYETNETIFEGSEILQLDITDDFAVNLLLRINQTYLNKTDYIDSYLARFGLTYQIFKGFYASLLYGPGFYDLNNDEYFHELIAKARYKRRNFDTAAMFEYYNYQTVNRQIWAPSVYFKYYFLNRFDAKLRYKFYLDSEKTKVHDIQLEFGYLWNPTIQTDLVFGGVVTFEEGEDRTINYEGGLRTSIHFGEDILFHLLVNGLAGEKMGFQCVATLELDF